MFNFLNGFWADSSKKEAQSDDAVEVAVKPRDVFIEALVRGDSATYTSPDYAAEVQLITPQVLLRLLRSNATEAFSWALQQKEFDLDEPVSGESEELSLLSYAVQHRNGACFAALAKQNPEAALVVPTEILTSIQKTEWEAFYRVVERSLDPQTAAIRYLNTVRRIAIDEANLTELHTGTGKDYRPANLNRLREKRDKIFTELTGFEEVYPDMDEARVAKLSFG